MSDNVAQGNQFDLGAYSFGVAGRDTEGTVVSQATAVEPSAASAASAASETGLPSFRFQEDQAKVRGNRRTAQGLKLVEWMRNLRGLHHGLGWDHRRPVHAARIGGSK